MTTTSKIPTYPTPSDIATEVANIAPDRDRYRAIWQAATEALAQLDNTSNPLNSLASHAVETGDIPTAEQMRDAAHAALTEDRDRAYMIGQLETIRQRYLTAPSEPTTEQAARILTYLGSEALPAVLTAVQALPKGTPLTADDALNHDDGPNLYRTARALLASYDAVRTQQRRAIQKIAASTVTDTDWAVMVAHSGTARNATDWDPHWLDKRRSIGQQYKAGIGQAHDQGEDRGAHDYSLNVPDTNWPALETRATWPANHDDDEQRARWLIRAARDLELWVPNFEQLTAEHTANSARVTLSHWLNTTTRRVTGYDRFGRRVTRELATIAGETTVLSTERSWPGE